MKTIKTEEEFQEIIKSYISVSNIAVRSFDSLKMSSSPKKLLDTDESHRSYRKIVVDVSNDSISDLYNFKAKVYNDLVETAYYNIATEYYIDEEIIRNNIELFDGDVLAENQVLSENFIEEYQEMLPWATIFLCQDLSTEFLTKHKDKIDEEFDFQSQAAYHKQVVEEREREKVDRDAREDVVEGPHPNAEQPANEQLRDLVDRVREMQENRQLNDLDRKLKRQIIIYRVIMGFVALLITASIVGSIIKLSDYFSPGESEAQKIEQVSSTQNTE